jgi:hypothetical protein
MRMGKRGSRKETAVRSRAPPAGPLCVRRRLCPSGVDRAKAGGFGGVPRRRALRVRPLRPPCVRRRSSAAREFGRRSGGRGRRTADVAGHRHGEGLGSRQCLSGPDPERQGTSIGRASPPACLFSEGLRCLRRHPHGMGDLCPRPVLAGLWVGSGVVRRPVPLGVGGSMASGQESAEAVGNPSKASDLGPCPSAVPHVEGRTERDVAVPPPSASSEGSRGRSDQASPAAPLSRPARRGRSPPVMKLCRPTDGRPLAGRG